MTAVRSAVLDGVEARLVEVQAITGAPGSKMHVVGLPDAVIRESRRRVSGAVESFDVGKQTHDVVFNLAPANLPKAGTFLDLALAVVHGAAIAQARLPRAADFLLAGEVGLDGAARSLPAALPVALLAKAEGFRGLILPRNSLREAAVVEDLDFVPIDHASEAFEFLAGTLQLERVAGRRPRRAATAGGIDLAEVRGQAAAVRALTVAAAGGHNLLMVGSPGAGKTMLARAMPGILPELALAEALEVARIHGAAGRPRQRGFYQPPFRAPHHSASRQALVGGGALPRPGEITLSHRGLLFLDELPEFDKNVLDYRQVPDSQ